MSPLVAVALIVLLPVIVLIGVRYYADRIAEWIYSTPEEK